MRLVHNVTLEVFSPPREVAAAERTLDALVPVPMVRVRETQWRWHPDKRKTKVYELPKRGVRVEESDADGIAILTYRFSKQKDTAAFVRKVRAGLGKEEAERLLADLDGSLDGEGRLLLRLSRKALEAGRVRPMRHEEFVMARVNLAAYPKNGATCAAAARALLEGAP